MHSSVCMLAGLFREEMLQSRRGPDYIVLLFVMCFLLIPNVRVLTLDEFGCVMMGLASI